MATRVAVRLGGQYSCLWTRIRRACAPGLLVGLPSLAIVAGVGCGRGGSRSEQTVAVSQAASLSPTGTSTATGTGTGACQPANAPALNSFAIYVAKSVQLDPGVVVKGGQVGVKDATGPNLFQDFALSLMQDAKVQPGAIYAPSVLLQSRSAASEVDTNRLVDQGATHGTVKAFPAMVTMGQGEE